ncbi:MAG: aminotransferase class III-fold pyridoxal phosphate-dependent enzyme [Akkermansiaceae bacterium]
MSQTISDQIKSDPTIASTVDQLLKRCLEIQQPLNGIQPAKSELKQSYTDSIKKFSDIRGGELFFPYLSTGAGSGPFVELADGSVKYDLTCGIGVHIMGHGHPTVMKASIEAGLEDVTMQGNLQQNVASMTLCEKLLDLAHRKEGSSLAHCFLSSSGVMAGENALKMAMQKNSPASRVLAFERCFAGRSLAFSQINDKPAFRDGLPEILNVDYVPFYDVDDPEGSTAKAVYVLKKHLTRHPKKHAAMLFELIQGEGGFHMGCENFHRTLMEICKEHNVAVLVDEVQTFCRTHHPFAFQEFNLTDLVDIVWVGKAAQVCATLFSKEFLPRPGLIAQTYTASSATIAASIAILNELDNGTYFGPNGKTAQLHQQFVDGFDAISNKHPDLLTGPYGIGAMTGCTVHGGDQAKVVKLIHHLYEKGIIAFLAGGNPTRLRFLVPIGALESTHIVEILEILEASLLETA